VHKPVLLARWKDEATFHQRLLYKLCKSFHELEYYDEELWTMLTKDLEHKLRINNLTFFSTFYETLSAINSDPKNPFFKRLDGPLKKLSEKHYTADRKWRYSLEDGGRMRTWDEIVANRENSDLSRFVIKKSDID
jgi:hypothetical protein